MTSTSSEYPNGFFCSDGIPSTNIRCLTLLSSKALSAVSSQPSRCISQCFFIAYATLFTDFALPPLSLTYWQRKSSKTSIRIGNAGCLRVLAYASKRDVSLRAATTDFFLLSSSAMFFADTGQVDGLTLAEVPV